jgi:hypothetical protein
MVILVGRQRRRTATRKGTAMSLRPPKPIALFMSSESTLDTETPADCLFVFRIKVDEIASLEIEP